MSVVICDLIAEEPRLKALTGILQLTGSSDTVIPASYPAQGKRDMSSAQCFIYQKFGHLATAYRDSPV